MFITLRCTLSCLVAAAAAAAAACHMARQRRVAAQRKQKVQVS